MNHPKNENHHHEISDKNGPSTLPHAEPCQQFRPFAKRRRSRFDPRCFIFINCIVNKELIKPATAKSAKKRKEKERREKRKTGTREGPNEKRLNYGGRGMI